MGKEWDGDKGGRAGWIAWMTEVMRECRRVMKPGAHGLVWALPRTSHWTATACEDAGFEIRDRIQHLFGQGFPKSLDISKALDRAAGAEREVVGSYKATGSARKMTGGNYGGHGSNVEERDRIYQTAPATDGAKKWAGFGTALKPACEDWWLVRKPISEKNVAANVLKWGVGGLNIDGCRIGTSKDVPASAAPPKAGNATTYGATRALEDRSGMNPNVGRFPSHLVLSHSPHCEEGQCDIECAIAQLDGQSGFLHGPGNKAPGSQVKKTDRSVFGMGGVGAPAQIYDRGGGASRFFYCAKISSSERNAGLEGMPDKAKRSAGGTTSSGKPTMAGRDRFGSITKNDHPTVKPQKLMRYLCKLITPPDGVVLDPFMGSGSTGIAAKAEGFNFLGIEQNPEYVAIAEKRIEAACQTA